MKTITQQLIASILITVLIVFGGWGYFDLRSTLRHEQESLNNFQKNIAERTAMGLEYSLWNLNVEGIRKLLHSVVLDEAVIAAIVYDETGAQFAGEMRENGKSGVVALLNIAKPLHRQVLERNSPPISTDIVHNGKRIGKLVLYANNEQLHSRMRQERFEFFGKLIALMVVLSLVLFLVLRKFVTRPTTLLKEWVVSYNPDQPHPLPELHKSEEISVLAEAFAGMARHLANSRNELAIGNKLLRSVLDNSFQLQGLLTLDGKVVDINVTALTMVNMSREAVLDRYFWDTPWWSSSAESVEMIRQAISKAANGEFVRFETKLSDVSGRIYELDYSLKPIVGDDGTVLFLIAEGRDITERRQLEKERVANSTREHFRQLVENANDTIFTLSLSGDLTYISPNCFDFIGYTAEEMTGRSIGQLVHPDDIETCHNFIRDIRIIGRKSHAEYRVLIKGGGVAYHSANGSLQQDIETGEQTIFCIARDITQQKREEAARQLEERRLQCMLKVAQFNPETAREFLDYSLDEAITLSGSRIGFIFKYDDAKKELFLAAFSHHVMELCAIPELVAPVYALDAIGVWGEPARTGNPLILNDFSQPYPAKHGYPQGHIAIHRYLGLPVYQEGRIVGIVGLANKKDEYTAEDARQLSLLIESIWGIARRKEIEEELRRNRERLDIAMSVARLAAWEFDLKTRIFTFDDQWFFLHHTTAEREGGHQIAVTTWLEKYVHPDSVREIREAMAQMTAPGEDVIEFDLDFRGIRHNIEPFDLLARVCFERDEQGNVIRCHGINQDITDRKRAEKELRDSQRRLADIVNFLPLATMVIDRGKRVTCWNHAMEEITGIKAENILGRGDFEYALPFYGERRPILIDLVSEDEKVIEKQYQHVVRMGGVLSAEAFIPKIGNHGVTLVAFASPLYDAEGELIGAIESIHDVTDIRRTELELKQAKEAADAANRAKSVFLANMSHEIRTPLNAILGFAQLMQRDPSLTLQLREHLDIINRSGEHLLGTINDILEMSKIEAGRTAIVATTFDLHALLYNLERMFRLRTDDKGLRFLVERVGYIPQWIKTDEGKLRQVLINLLGNAVKFTEEGGVVLRICGRAENTSIAQLQFEMEDTGPGMSDEETGRLFQAFEQSGAGIKSGGTGLGLALSQGFVKIMGGTISVTSAIGKGSIFRFAIPVQEGSEDNAVKKEARQRVQCLKPGQEAIRILVVDDRETNRKLLLQLLVSVGFVTNQAANGKEAISLISQWEPHLVLMDMAMPVMDGYEATRAIKASPDLRHTAIVAVTASAFEEDKQRILAAGADDYLSKPFKDSELFAIIGRLTGAEYLYAESGSEAKTALPAGDVALMRKAVAALPTDFVHRMLSAVESADLDLINELALQLGTDHPTIAQQVKKLASRYEYDRLIKLFSEDKP